MNNISNLNITDREKKILNDWVGFFSFKPTWQFKHLMNCNTDIICLFTGNQCLASGEYLYTENGIKLVDNVNIGDNTLGGKITSKKESIDDIYEVTFQTGHKIRVTAFHPFYTVDYKRSKKENWKMTCELKDKYVQFIKSNIIGNKIENPRLLGYLTSDGYIYKDQSVNFSNTNINFRKEVEKLCTDLGYQIVYRKCGKTFTIKYDQGKDHPLKKYIFSLGYSRDSFGEIINSTRENIKEFLIGYFNGDGYLLNRKRKNGYGKTPSVEVGFCIGLSKNKAYEFQYMLWRLGITSYVVKELMKKSTDYFYRVKVNTFCAKKIIDILEHTKYPEKFKKSLEYIEQNKFKRLENNEWIHVKKIEHLGVGKVYNIECENHEIISYSGMRTHNSCKTSGAAMWNVMSIMGLLPVEHKNIRPNDPIRILRFASETLPNESEGKEVKNTQYPEFKKWLPPSLIKKDITLRKPVMTLFDPQGGPDIYIEFVSFSQDLQAQAGVQRRRVWIDEHCKKSFYEEQLPRLLASGGDMLFTLTPAQEYMDWEFDEFYEKAGLFIRTPAVVERIKQRTGKIEKNIEEKEDGKSITIIMAATDDNPTLDKETIDRMFDLIGDEDIIDIRRYGLFKQISGRIFKNMDKHIHVINKERYFPNGIPYDWLHARGIDFHEHNPWAIGWISLSPTNEAFIWNEFYPSPENMVTHDIVGIISDKSGDYRYFINKIDPLAAKNQSNTGMSVVDDINRYLYEYRKDGRGTGGSFTTWDTKSTRGRDEIRMRLANSLICGVPFNNKIHKNGKDIYLPTLWICDTCRNSIDHMWNWKKEEWGNRELALQKDSKDQPQQKWSHFNMVWEGIFKDSSFNHRYSEKITQRESPYKNYMRR